MVLTARRLAPLQAIAAGHGERALALQLDVTDPAARAAALKKTVETFGRLDVLANIAGAGSYGGAGRVHFRTDPRPDGAELLCGRRAVA